MEHTTTHTAGAPCGPRSAPLPHPSLPIPAAGVIFHSDYREPERAPGAAGASHEEAGPSCSPRPRERPRDRVAFGACSEPLRILQWNIERGYKLQGIIAELQRVDADLILLQEVDVGNKRTGNADTGAEIARALRMNYAFVAEFEEHYCGKLRKASTQGGGLHGHAILSKHDFLDLRVIVHQHQLIDWDNPTHGLAKKEPRQGVRVTLVADVATPAGVVTAYCAHLECFAGILGRVAQFSEIVADARERGRALAAAGERCMQVVAGDLNTLGHGAARLSRYHCNDALRFRSLGMTEAQWWDRHILGCRESDGNVINKELVKFGIAEDIARDVVNPGFTDPFDVLHDPTLDFFGAGSLLNRLGLGVVGKLDWIMLRGVCAGRTQVGNDAYELSDHKWLLAEVTPSHLGALAAPPAAAYLTPPRSEPKPLHASSSASSLASVHATLLGRMIPPPPFSMSAPRAPTPSKLNEPLVTKKPASQSVSEALFCCWPSSQEVQRAAPGALSPETGYSRLQCAFADASAPPRPQFINHPGASPSSSTLLPDACPAVGGAPHAGANLKSPRRDGNVERRTKHMGEHP